MLQTFLILLAGGIMLAAAVSAPRQVSIHWLRLAGILALTMAGLGAFFAFSREGPPVGSIVVQRVQVGLIVATLVAILGQLAFVQVAWLRVQRICAVAGFIVAVLAGSHLLHEMMTMAVPPTAVRFPPKGWSMTLQALACAGVSAMTGLVLMDMLLGHAYLTAARMGIAPFRRLNAILAGVLIGRTLLALPLVLLLQAQEPLDMLWGLHGLLIGTRWLVGLAVPGVFIYMAHDCIRRRSTQSATGILYVAGVAVFIGEIVALYLVRSTGLPF